MKKIAVFFATGFEEIEALTVVDLCRRAQIDVTMVSVTGDKQVTGSHGITVLTDAVFEEMDCSLLDMLVLPGGMPGTNGLENHEGLMVQVDTFFSQEKYVAAICAAPSIFGHRGIVKGKEACCYPGFESHMEGALVNENAVNIAKNVITSRGMGTAIDFGLAIVETLCGKDSATILAEKIVYFK